MPKYYYVVAYDQYYPCGFPWDIQFITKDKGQAHTYATTCEYDTVKVMDIDPNTGEFRLVQGYRTSPYTVTD